MPSPGSGDLVSRLWAWVFVIAGLAFAAHLFSLFVIPVLPYLLGIGIAVLIGYAVAGWRQRRRW